jgi:hypothetical protein
MAKNHNEQTLFSQVIKTDLIKQGEKMREKGTISNIGNDPLYVLAKIIIISAEIDIILYPFAIPPENQDYVSCFVFQDGDVPEENSIPIAKLEQDYKTYPKAFIIDRDFKPLRIDGIEMQSEILNSNNYKFKAISSVFSSEQIKKFEDDGLSFEDIYNKSKQY